ncbi:MAG: hypothetical protein ACJ8C4_09275 [Gemmataceae bacterium]
MANTTPVRIELRQPGNRPSFHEVTGAEFLLGSVLGCDLILPGGDLPPVFGVIARTDDGIRLRKLAPNFKLMLNGKPVQHAPLGNGDTIAIGKAEIVIHMPAMANVAAPPVAVGVGASTPHRPSAAESLRSSNTWSSEDPSAPTAPRSRIAAEGRPTPRQPIFNSRDLEARQRDLEAREEALAGERQRIDAAIRDHREDLARLDRQRAVIESSERDIQSRLASVAQREEQVQRDAILVDEKARQITQAEIAIAEEQKRLDQSRTDAGTVQAQAELKLLEADRRTALLQGMEARLQRMREELDREALSLSEERKQHDARMANLPARENQLNARIVQIENTERAQFEQQRALDEREAAAGTLAAELATRQASFSEIDADLRHREEQLARDQQTLASDVQRCQENLARLDRWRDNLENQQQDLTAQESQLAARKMELDERAAQIEREAAAHHEQSRRVSEAEAKLQAELERVRQLQIELESNSTKLAEQAATSEGQQTILANLRAKMERMREELRTQARELDEQRARQATVERELAEKQARLEAEQNARDHGQAEFTEQAAALKAAIAKARELQDRVAAEEQALFAKAANTQVEAGEHVEQANTLRANSAQLLAMHHQLEAERNQLEADRATFKERERLLSQTEESRSRLQEQLVQRSRELDAMRITVEEQAATIARDRQLVDSDFGGLRHELDEKAAELQQLGQELAEREDQLQHRLERLKEIGQTLAAERKHRAEAKAQWEEETRQAAEDLARIRAELEAYRGEALDKAVELQEVLPELELRGTTALERLSHAREELKHHVAELHEVAQQSREDLELLRQKVQSDTERLKAQHSDLGKARFEHRLAVTAFRQQLIDWQGRVGEMKQTLVSNRSRSESPPSDLDAAAQDIDATTQLLARQAEQLDQPREEVAYHLSGMRDWFRRKLRELAYSGAKKGPAVQAGANQILSMRAELDPGDRTLGELLRSLELVDDQTLSALWLEARRQRRSLRQVLLASGKLTVYQMALIEAGNVDNLCIGPLGVIDRLRVTPHESVYRVIDPRPGNLTGPLVLRHLADVEMQDAVRPDEFRQRFAALAELRHPHIAATIEVLEINDRPAALQEWLTGLTGSDWPSLAASPGVWYRLTCQALLGLATAHQWGLIHGAISAKALVLTPDGLVKLTGVGEPVWLTGADVNATAADDVTALGQVAASWAALVPKRKGAKPPRPLPKAVRAVLDNWAAGGYDSAAAVLEELDRSGSDVPSGVETWERLVKFAGENSSEGVTWRKSA